MSKNRNGGMRLGFKGAVGIASCMAGAAVVYFALGTLSEPVKKDAGASAKPPAEDGQRHRPVRAMNMALGNMVYFAQELGFAVKTADDGPYESSKVALRIESQLQKLREIYRQESANNARLAGGLLLQINVGSAGEVGQVKEISSFIDDAEFRKTVLAEASNWSFAEIVSEPVVINCPLLFVREGMDITTLLQWEKTRGDFVDKGNLARVEVAAKQPAASPPAASSAAKARPNNVKPALNPSPTASKKAEPKIFQLKYPTSLRKDPSFSSSALATFAVGTKIAVINSRDDDWLEVKTTDNRHAGFIRKEFAVPLDGAN